MESKPLSCRISPAFVRALDKWVSRCGWTQSRSAAAVYLVQSFFASQDGCFWNKIDVIQLREPVTMEIQLPFTDETLNLVRSFAEQHGVSMAHAVRVILYDRLYHHGGDVL